MRKGCSNPSASLITSVLYLRPNSPFVFFAQPSRPGCLSQLFPRMCQPCGCSTWNPLLTHLSWHFYCSVDTDHTKLPSTNHSDDPSTLTASVGFPPPDLPPGSSILGGFHLSLLRLCQSCRIYISGSLKGVALLRNNLTLPSSFHPHSKLPLRYRAIILPAGYSGHIYSFRIGAATSASASGMPDHVIQKLSRWKSDAFKTYVRLDPKSLSRSAIALANS